MQSLSLGDEVQGCWRVNDGHPARERSSRLLKTLCLSLAVETAGADKVVRRLHVLRQPLVKSNL